MNRGAFASCAASGIRGGVSRFASRPATSTADVLHRHEEAASPQPPEGGKRQAHNPCRAAQPERNVSAIVVARTPGKRRRLPRRIQRLKRE